MTEREMLLLEGVQLGHKAELSLAHFQDILNTLEGNTKQQMLNDYRTGTNIDSLIRSTAYLTALDDIRNVLRTQLLKKVKYEKEKFNASAEQ